MSFVKWIKSSIDMRKAGGSIPAQIVRTGSDYQSLGTDGKAWVFGYEIWRSPVMVLVAE